MDVARLRLLRELGDRGSVTAVAAAMHVSPSAVSQQLAALQAGIPAPLTTKRGRALVLTDAGRALAAAGMRVEEALVAARESVDGFHERDDRLVRLSAFHSAGLALFRPLLAALGDAPSIAVSDADVARDRFVGLTADQDLVVAHRMAHDPAWPSDRVVVTPLFVEPLDIAVSVDHPLARERTIDPTRLRGETWLATHEGFPLGGMVQTLAALGGEPPRILHRVNELFVAAEVVRSGSAIAVMPRFTARALAVDGMTLRPLSGVTLARHVDALARPDAMASAAVRRVLASLVEVAARLAR